MRRFLIVWHFFLPLEYSCWSSGSAGRWIGRSVPSCQKGGTEEHLPSVWRQAAPLTHRPCGLVGALGVLKPDSTQYGGDESTYWYSIGTSQRAALALLEWDSVSDTSE